jgi:hypothetical protein
MWPDAPLVMKFVQLHLLALLFGCIIAVNAAGLLDGGQSFARRY